MLASMTYPGGKNGAGTYQKIINLMPVHTVYIEPFLGSGAIMRRKRPAILNIGIDVDAEAVTAVSADIAKSNGVRSRTVARSRIVFPGGAGSCAAPTSTIATFCDRVLASRFCFLCEDALDWLAEFKPEGRELIYLDPPYLMETRRSGPLYKFEMTTHQHRWLLVLIQRIKCRVMISGYWSRLYATALRGWNSIRFMSMTRGGTPAEEWVWFNYPWPVDLHDYRYLGNSFRERERIKRRIVRWKGRLGRMDRLERQALLGAIGEVWGSGATPAPLAASGDTRGNGISLS